MIVEFFAGPSVDLKTVLEARDERIERRKRIFEKWQRPVVSLSIVMPGPVKDCAASRYLRQEALDALMPTLGRRGWSADIGDVRNGAAGPEAMIAVAASPSELKLASVEIEDTHPLGRLWDLDVIDPETGAVSRRSLGQPARRCLVCSEPAHACARSRAHSLDELLNAIKAIIDAYRSGAEA
jgi:holo-ACP synthase